MRNSPSSPVDLRPIIMGGVVLMGLLGAIFAGKAVASENYKLLIIIAGSAVALAIPLLMKEKVWLLIPATWLLTGTVGALPLPFNVREIGILAAFGSFVVFSLMKKVDRPARFGALDGLMIVNLVYLITVYARNPAGVAFIQTDLVGGRPYLTVTLSALAFWVLQRITIGSKMALWLPAVQSVGGIFGALMGVLTARFPFLVPFIFPIYSGVSIDSYLRQQSGAAREDFAFGEARENDLLAVGTTTIPFLLAYLSPMRMFLFLTPLRSLIFYLAIIGILLSGFRSATLAIGVYIMLASYFREGISGAVRVGFCVLLGTLMLIVVNSAGITLPISVQRALSFLPGEWEARAIEAADSSSEWRYEMWRTTLSSDKYIHNKILGDGFGYDINVFSAFVARTSLGGSGVSTQDQQEYFMITGAYHSGPVSAIRYVGVVGLLLYTGFAVAMSVYAWRLIKLCKGSPFLPAALFFGIPVIYKPFEYWFVFGSFENDFPQAIIWLAFLNLIARSFARWRATRTEELAHSEQLPTVA